MDDENNDDGIYDSGDENMDENGVSDKDEDDEVPVPMVEETPNQIRTRKMNAIFALYEIDIIYSGGIVAYTSSDGNFYGNFHRIKGIYIDSQDSCGKILYEGMCFNIPMTDARILIQISREISKIDTRSD